MLRVGFCRKCLFAPTRTFASQYQDYQMFVSFWGGDSITKLHGSDQNLLDFLWPCVCGLPEAELWSWKSPNIWCSGRLRLVLGQVSMCFFGNLHQVFHGDEGTKETGHERTPRWQQLSSSGGWIEERRHQWDHPTTDLLHEFGSSDLQQIIVYGFLPELDVRSNYWYPP